MKNKRDNKLLVVNMISSGLFQLLMLMVPIITTPYVSRIFSPEDIGLYATSLGYTSIFVAISAFGIPIFGPREIAKTNGIYERTTTFMHIWSVQIICSLSSFLFFLLISSAKPERNIYLVQSLLIIISIFDVSWFFIGIEEIRKNLFRNFITKLVATCLIFLTIKSKNQLLLYTAINVGAMLLGNISMFIQLPRYLSIKNVKIEVKINYQMFLTMFTLMIPMLLDTFKNSISKIILNWQTGNYEVGIYDQGIKIIIICLGIVTSMSNAIAPRMSYLVSIGSEEQLSGYFEKFSRLIFALSIMLITGITSVGEFFVPIFFGFGYEDVLPVLLIGSFSILFSSLNVFMMNGLIIPKSKDSLLLKSSFFSAVTIVIFNLIFDPFLKAIGAALAFSISSIVLFMIYCYILKADINLKLLLINLTKCLVLILIFSSIIIFIKAHLTLDNNILSFFFYAIVTIVICLLYFIVCFIFNKCRLKNKVER
ncbi:oligosaccharide flippase family protein [Enterococcus sp.]|uniref:oligosaccharide flippase family protein n=1 Tax=Enterococcus sp. TaxID=35783 RepID=UPI003C716E5E